MADTNIQNPQQGKDQAQNLQSQIDDLHSKAQSSSGAEKQGYMQKIDELKQKKDSILAEVNDWEAKGKAFQDKAEGFLDKI